MLQSTFENSKQLLLKGCEHTREVPSSGHGGKPIGVVVGTSVVVIVVGTSVVVTVVGGWVVVKFW